MLTKDIREAAKEYTELALQTLSAALTAKRASWPARISAATALLDRAYGKATQTVAGDPDKPITWMQIVETALAIPRDQVRPPPWLEEELRNKKEALN